MSADVPGTRFFTDGTMDILHEFVRLLQSGNPNHSQSIVDLNTGKFGIDILEAGIGNFAQAVPIFGKDNYVNLRYQVSLYKDHDKTTMADLNKVSFFTFPKSYESPPNCNETPNDNCLIQCQGGNITVERVAYQFSTPFSTCTPEFFQQFSPQNLSEAEKHYWVETGPQIVKFCGSDFEMLELVATNPANLEDYEFAQQDYCPQLFEKEQSLKFGSLVNLSDFQASSSGWLKEWYSQNYSQAPQKLSFKTLFLDSIKFEHPDIVLNTASISKLNLFVQNIETNSVDRIFLPFLTITFDSVVSISRGQPCVIHNETNHTTEFFLVTAVNDKTVTVFYPQAFATDPANDFQIKIGNFVEDAITNIRSTVVAVSAVSKEPFSNSSPVYLLFGKLMLSKCLSLHARMVFSNHKLVLSTDAVISNQVKRGLINVSTDLQQQLGNLVPMFLPLASTREEVVLQHLTKNFEAAKKIILTDAERTQRVYLQVSSNSFQLDIEKTEASFQTLFTDKLNLSNLEFQRDYEGSISCNNSPVFRAKLPGDVSTQFASAEYAYLVRLPDNRFAVTLMMKDGQDSPFCYTGTEILSLGLYSKKTACEAQFTAEFDSMQTGLNSCISDNTTQIECTACALKLIENNTGSDCTPLILQPHIYSVAQKICQIQSVVSPFSDIDRFRLPLNTSGFVDLPPRVISSSISENFQIKPLLIFKNVNPDIENENEIEYMVESEFAANLPKLKTFSDLFRDSFQPPDPTSIGCESVWNTLFDVDSIQNSTCLLELHDQSLMDTCASPEKLQNDEIFPVNLRQTGNDQQFIEVLKANLTVEDQELQTFVPVSLPTSEAANLRFQDMWELWKPSEQRFVRVKTANNETSGDNTETVDLTSLSDTQPKTLLFRCPKDKYMFRFQSINEGRTLFAGCADLQSTQAGGGQINVTESTDKMQSMPASTKSILKSSDESVFLSPRSTLSSTDFVSQFFRVFISFFLLAILSTWLILYID